MIKKAISVEIMNFFERFDQTSKNPSRQAFSKARNKISYLAFKDFFDKTCELAITGEDAKVFKGFRIFAVDGTSFFVGDLAIPSIKEFFDDHTTVEGKAMCRISGVVDVLNNCIVNATVSGFSTGERSLAIRQAKELKSVLNALFLYDRGYWSPDLVREIHGNGQKFVMRLASNISNTVVKDQNGNNIELRKFSFILPSDETETLLTNLTLEEVSDEELIQLYTRRWGIETKYLELKERLEINSFSGQSANTVLQDIYSTLYISNLVAFTCFQSDEIIQAKTASKCNKYEQKTNRSNCISALRDRFVSICLMDSPSSRVEALKRLVKDISQNVTYVCKSKPRPRDKRKIKASRSRLSKKSAL
jgi:hypothetical protein